MKYFPDFKKLHIVFKPNIRGKWIGDWDLKTSQIMISKNLSEIDSFAVIVHEFIEMMCHTMLKIPDCCQKEYKEKIHDRKNAIAHDLANKVERMVLELGGYSWGAHQRRIRKAIRTKGGDMS